LQVCHLGPAAFQPCEGICVYVIFKNKKMKDEKHHVRGRKSSNVLRANQMADDVVLHGAVFAGETLLGITFVVDQGNDGTNGTQESERRIPRRLSGQSPGDSDFALQRSGILLPFR
jgi:hypothetical protein